MLLEIAAANAAFGVLKTALSNGRDLYECGNVAKKYFDNKSVIAKRVASKGKSDLDAFMALEKIKEQEEWLREYMIYAGRPDMYADFLKFQAECKQERDQAARMALAKKHLNIKMFKQFIMIIGVAVAVIPVMIYALIYLLNTQQGAVMVDTTKEVLDVAAASTAVLSMAAWLPPTASILTILWLGIRIYESDTVQRICYGKPEKQLDKQD